jgi:hypothetical protein
MRHMHKYVKVNSKLWKYAIPNCDKTVSLDYPKNKPLTPDQKCLYKLTAIFVIRGDSPAIARKKAKSLLS